MISFEDFKKLDLRVATILSASKIKGSNKLLRLQVDLGEVDHTVGRQIISGIGQYYDPEKLVGTNIVVIANLEPKTFTIQSDSGPVSLESQGMLLAADSGRPVILKPDTPVNPGSKIS